MNYHFCLHVVPFRVLIKHRLTREMILNGISFVTLYGKKKASAAKLILLFKTSDLMTAKLFSGSQVARKSNQKSVH